YGMWPETREDALRLEQLGWHEPQWPRMRVGAASPSMAVPYHQSCADDQHAPTGWELDMSTAHEYVMAEEADASITLSFDAPLQVGYVLSDTNALSIAHEVHEVESLLSLFKVEDDDIIPPQTRSPGCIRFALSCVLVGMRSTTVPKEHPTHGLTSNKDAQVYELAEEEPDSDYDTISLGSEASWLHVPHMHSLRSTASMVNRVRSASISRTTSQISLKDDQGKQEGMQVVSEESPWTLSGDESGDLNSELNSALLELEKQFYIDHDLIHISRHAIGFGAFATIFKGTLLPQKLESRLHTVTEPLQRHPHVNTQLSLLDLILFCRQISDGMNYLSSRGFIHRLLNAQSILLTSDMNVKIGTFTHCIRSSADVYNETDDKYPLFAAHSAPEVLNSMQFSTKSDVILSSLKEESNSFVVEKLLSLSEKNVGATVILDVKRRSFEDTILKEVIMDAEGDVPVFRKGTLASIYDTKSPGHDGAVVISLFKDNKACPLIAATQCCLLTPAPIFVISEERGTISYACGGRLERDVSTERLLTIISASIAVELVCEDEPIRAQSLMDPATMKQLASNLRILPHSFATLSSGKLWYTCRYKETHMQLHQGFPRKLFLPDCDDDAPVAPVDTDVLDFIENSDMRGLELLQTNPSMRCYVVERCGVRLGGYFAHFDSDRSAMVLHHPFIISRYLLDGTFAAFVSHQCAAHNYNYDRVEFYLPPQLIEPFGAVISLANAQHDGTMRDPFAAACGAIGFSCSMADLRRVYDHYDAIMPA
ncbi:TK/KIN6 protein kinase, partial [Aphelenchoides avenae]